MVLATPPFWLATATTAGVLLRVLATGDAFWASDFPFALERHGFPEETYFDISYDPVRDESGGVGGVFCIVSETTGRVIGDAGFGVFAATGDVELGYTLARDAWGRGYATEAAGACLAAGLEHLGVPRIVALVDAENEASTRVATRIGLALTESVQAHGRPHLLFATRPG